MRDSGIATPAYGTSGTYPASGSQRLYLSGADRLVTSQASVLPGSATYANVAGEAPLSYSEGSAVQGDAVPNDVTAPYDVTKPVEIELPGVVHRYAAGQVVQVVVSATDAAYRNNAAVQPVTVLTSPTTPGTLFLPVLGDKVG